MPKTKTSYTAKNTPEQVMAAVEEMIREYEEDRILPTDYQLMCKTGVKSRTIDRWYSGELDREDRGESGLTYKDCMDKLKMFREHMGLMELNSAPKSAPNVMFRMKQARWGGYQDVQRVESSGKQEIKITLVDEKGKAIKGRK